MSLEQLHEILTRMIDHRTDLGVSDISTWIKEHRLSLARVTRSQPMDDGVVCTPVEDSGVRAEWVRPAGVDSDRVFIYLHGGAFVAGEAEMFRSQVASLARFSGVAGLTVGYRLAPEHPFPVALEDTLAVYRWLLAKGYPPQRIALVGISAGGSLVMATLLRLKQLDLSQPVGAALMSPFLDLEGTGRSVKENEQSDALVDVGIIKKLGLIYKGSADMNEPLVSPLKGDLTGLAPLFIQVGTAEVFLDDARRLADLANEAGLEVNLDLWPDMIHGWHNMADQLDEGREALERTGQWLNKKLWKS